MAGLSQGGDEALPSQIESRMQQVGRLIKPAFLRVDSKKHILNTFYFIHNCMK